MIQERNSNLTWGAFIAGVMILLIIIGQISTPYDPNAMSAARSQAPSLNHLLGTDNFGRDIFSRVLIGAGATFVIALCTVAIGALVGVVAGAELGTDGAPAPEQPASSAASSSAAVRKRTLFFILRSPPNHASAG